MLLQADPYAIISVGESSARSKVVSANLNPSWDQRLVLYVRNLETDLLKVS